MIPYVHIQVAHGFDMTMDIHPYTLGRLRNDVMKCKHKEMKIFNSNRGGGRGVSNEYRNNFEHEKMCLVNEMRSQFFKLVMWSKGTF